MGFGFLHPLAPSLPSSVDLTLVETTVKPAPRWRLRGWHVHTEHPIELNDLLTGFDVTMKNGTVLETWASMLPDWESFLQWCLAQGLNRYVSRAKGVDDGGRGNDICLRVLQHMGAMATKCQRSSILHPPIVWSGYRSWPRTGKSMRLARSASCAS